MRPPAPSASRDRILHALKTKGPATAASLARRLAVTPTAVRQHLSILEEEGLVAHEDRAGQVGRPKRTWRLAPAAQAMFPDSHAELAVGLVESVREAFGEKGLSRIVRERTRLQAAAYRALMPRPTAPLSERVAALTRIRKDEGYMAACEPDGGGALRLVENHCPICAAATACVGICEGELRLFEEVLGPGVEVERLEHVLAGDRRCSYRISPRGAYGARRG